MPFAADRFERAEFRPRTSRVAVPALADFFDAGEAPEWEVRGLSAAELHQAMEAGKRQVSVEAIVQALASKAEQVEALRRAIGLGNQTPGELAKRLEMLVLGSVAPKIGLPIAVKLAEAFPVDFLVLTNEITDLTGKGAELGKPDAASQPTPA